MAKKNVDVLVFDFDGVLIDSGLDIASAMNYVLQHFNLSELPAEVIISFIGRGAGMLVRDSLGPAHGDLLDQALEMFLQRYSQYYLVDTGLYPGVDEVLAYYHRAGKTLAIATQKAESITHAILAGLNINPYISIVVGPESITHRKPHPESILKILKDTHTDPQRLIMVGDMPTDIQAGKAAATLTCAVTYGLGQRSDLQATNPDFIIDQLTGLCELVD
jgi:phosphoglycolate phosphatase